LRFPRISPPVLGFRSLTLLALFNVILIFLIFVFFLPFITNPTGLSVVLPRAITSELLSHKDVIVSIMKDNTLYCDTKQISIEELMRLIEAKKGGIYQVLIKADHRASVGALVRVWDLFRQANVSRINIATNE
jgi:biopolymer transport protein ExbD